jgi:apolipoprotein N-acyltransferase
MTLQTRPPGYVRDTGQMPSSSPGEQPALFRVRWAALLSLIGGGLGALAFPRVGIWPFAFLSVALLSVAVDGRRSRTGAWLGFGYGLAFFVPLLHWTGVYVGAAPWLILAVAEAGFFAALGAVLPLVQRLRLAPLWVACTWVLVELLRDRLPFGGFPWGRLAFSQASSPLRWFAALGGAPLVTFAVALCGAGLAAVQAFGSVPHMRNRLGTLGIAVALLVPLVGGMLSWPLDLGSDQSGRTAVVALVQGNVPDLGLAFEQRARQVLDNHVAETMKLAAQIKAGAVPRPSLIVWPENSSDVDPFADQAAFAEIDATVRSVGIPILVGAILQGPGANHRRNAGILWSPTSGPGAQYIKRHPVPFGEYIPLRGIAKLVTHDVNLVSQDMVGGSGNGLLAGGPFPIGDVICFEVAYDGLVRSSVRAGAQVLVVQTNNATFGHTAETYQQLAMSRLRAVETGRVVLQVATTGKTAAIGPDGGIRQESGALFTPDVIVATIALRSGQTLATRIGALPEYVFATLALLAIVYGLKPVRQRLRRRSSESPREMMLT